MVAIVVESAFMQSRRPQQEDRHVKILDLTKAGKSLKMSIEHWPQPCSLMAVYDGHRGPVCADYVAKHLHLKLLKHLSAAVGDDVALCFRGACEELDKEFLSRHRSCVDGCCVVLALLTGDLLSVAWLGDSRALLAQRSAEGFTARPLTADHRPSQAYEAQRVQRAGGQVVNFDGARRVPSL